MKRFSGGRNHLVARRRNANSAYMRTEKKLWCSLCSAMRSATIKPQSGGIYILDECFHERSLLSSEGGVSVRTAEA
jgi:hypothetical protein